MTQDWGPTDRLEQLIAERLFSKVRRLKGACNPPTPLEVGSPAALVLAAAFGARSPHGGDRCRTLATVDDAVAVAAQCAMWLAHRHCTHGSAATVLLVGDDSAIEQCAPAVWAAMYRATHGINLEYVAGLLADPTAGGLTVDFREFHITASTLRGYNPSLDLAGPVVHLDVETLSVTAAVPNDAVAPMEIVLAGGA